MKRNNTLLLFGGLALGIILGLAILAGSGVFSGDKGSGSQALAVSNSAPDFTLATVDGKQMSLSQYKGHPLVINFWATWCSPCREEMPLLDRYSQKYSPELIILGVNYEEGKVVVQQYLEKSSITFPVILDTSGRVATLYQVRGFPTSFFIDKDGILRSEHIGQLNEDLLMRYLETIGLKQ